MEVDVDPVTPTDRGRFGAFFLHMQRSDRTHPSPVRERLTVPGVQFNHNSHILQAKVCLPADILPTFAHTCGISPGVLRSFWILVVEPDRLRKTSKTARKSPKKLLQSK